MWCCGFQCAGVRLAKFLSVGRYSASSYACIASFVAIHAHIYTDLSRRTYTYIHTYIYAYIYIYSYMYTYVMRGRGEQYCILE
jgi:uncharacterized membrane protein YoaT (DUF817 family)